MELSTQKLSLCLLGHITRMCLSKYKPACITSGGHSAHTPSPLKPLLANSSMPLLLLISSTFALYPPDASTTQTCLLLIFPDLLYPEEEVPPSV